MKRVDDNNPCPLCHGTLVRGLFSARDYVTKMEMSVEGCSECGLYRTVAPVDLDVFYPPGYRRYIGIVSSALQSLYRTQVKRWIGRRDVPGAVLEIGCGPGWMLEEFQKRGWKAVGVERGDERFRRERFSFLLVDSIDHVPPDERFDIVLMFQSLEHVHDPLGTLRECRRRMRQGARLIVSVPNAASWQAKYFKADWFHLDVPRHLYHFTPESLSRCLTVCGFQVRSINNAALLHDCYGWIQSALNRIGIAQNALTMRLMRLPGEVTAGESILSFMLAAGMLLPALVLAILSRPFGRGAIVEVHATAE